MIELRAMKVRERVEETVATLKMGIKSIQGIFKFYNVKDVLGNTVC